MAEITEELEDRLNEIGQLLENASSIADKIEEATNTMAEESADTLAYLEGPSTELINVSDDAATEIERIWTNGQQDIENAVDAAVTSFSQQKGLIEASIEDARAEYREWTDLENRVSTSLEEFRVVAVAQFESLVVDWQAVSSGIVSNTQQVEGALTQIGADLDQAGSEAIQSILEAIKAVLEHTKTQGEKFSEEQKGNFTELFAQSQEALAAVSDSEIEELSRVQDLLQEALQDATSGWLEEQKDKLVEALEDVVKREIAEAIIVSQLGVATTGVLTPYMPALITVKHSADTLLELIQVWKEAKEGLGL